MVALPIYNRNDTPAGILFIVKSGMDAETSVYSYRQHFSSSSSPVELKKSVASGVCCVSQIGMKKHD